MTSGVQKMFHDKIIEKLEERLKQYCQIVSIKGEYKFPYQEGSQFHHDNGVVFGEFDVVGIHNNNILLFAVKTHQTESNIHKVRYQLARDSEYLRRICQDYKILTFYAYSSDRKPDNLSYRVDKIDLNKDTKSHYNMSLEDRTCW